MNGRCRSRFTAPPPPLRRGSGIYEPPRYGGGDGRCISGGEGSNPISARYGRYIVKWRNYRDFKKSRHGMMVGLMMPPAAYVSKKKNEREYLKTLLLLYFCRKVRQPGWMAGLGSLSVLNSTNFPLLLPLFPLDKYLLHQILFLI